MSSMFKKKGGLAFKPKAPQLRRPGAPGAPPASAPAATAPATTEPPEASGSAAATTSTPPPVPALDAPPAAPAPTPPSTATAEPEQVPATSIQRSSTVARTRRASHARESTSTPAPPLPPTPSPTQSRARARGRRAATSQQETEPEAASVETQGSATIVAGRTTATATADAGLAAQDVPASLTTAAPDAERPLTARRGRPTVAEKAASVVTEAIEAPAVAVADVIPTTETDPASAVANAPPKKRKYVRRKPGADVSAEGNQEGPGITRKPRAAAGTAKRAAASSTQQELAGTPGTPGTEGSEGTTAGTPAPSAPKRARKERSVTPEDAETRTVDHRELKMEDLTKDLRIGKKFSRHDELVDRLREKRRQYRKERLQNKKSQAEGAAAGGPLSANTSRAGSVLDSEFGDAATGAAGSRLAGGINVVDAASAAASVLAAASAAAKAKSSASSSGVVAGPQFEIIDGAIVVNQASLVHDRHAAAAAEAGELEEVEENDFTRQTTSNTYLKPGKLRGPNAWTDEETELFYRALSMFGTSFDLICKWFPGKSRRHIKMKFNREDKLRPDRITQALVGQNKVAIDVDEYMARTGVTLHATETIDAEYALRQAEHDAEQQRIVDEQAEALRKKREALFGPRSIGNANTNAGAGAGLSKGNNDAPGEAGGPSTLNENEIDETDLMDGSGKGKRGRGGRGAGRRSGAGGARTMAGGFGV
ncbi:transcription factor tfiiib [Ophiostoma piceae UAMH 11346]|uniref:Transcription factor tfiiib n=1 Tax=Ophiostoma piceae (strain UAMH 11346) TaxID=1262450 RepID=S3C9Y7_OPHP1|nr:transcription factor tfiiib [Ophiostoma piceae UAMH 11346]